MIWIGRPRDGDDTISENSAGEIGGSTTGSPALRTSRVVYLGGVIGAQVDEPAPTMSMPVLESTTADSSVVGE